MSRQCDHLARCNVPCGVRGSTASRAGDDRDDSGRCGRATSAAFARAGPRWSTRPPPEATAPAAVARRIEDTATAWRSWVAEHDIYGEEGTL